MAFEYKPFSGRGGLSYEFRSAMEFDILVRSRGGINYILERRAEPSVNYLELKVILTCNNMEPYRMADQITNEFDKLILESIEFERMRYQGDDPVHRWCGDTRSRSYEISIVLDLTNKLNSFSKDHGTIVSDLLGIELLPLRDERNKRKKNTFINSSPNSTGGEIVENLKEATLDGSGGISVFAVDNNDSLPVLWTSFMGDALKIDKVKNNNMADGIYVSVVHDGFIENSKYISPEQFHGPELNNNGIYTNAIDAVKHQNSRELQLARKEYDELKKEYDSSIKTMNKEYEWNVKALRKECDTLKKECDTTVNTLRKEYEVNVRILKKDNDLLKKECDATVNTLKKECDNTVNTLKKECDSTVKAIKTKCDDITRAVIKESYDKVNEKTKETEEKVDSYSRAYRRIKETADLLVLEKDRLERELSHLKAMVELKLERAKLSIDQHKSKVSKDKSSDNFKNLMSLASLGISAYKVLT